MRQLGNIEVHGDIRPADVSADDWNAERFERAVMANLNRISESDVGSAVLSQVVGPLLIIPYREQHAFPNARANYLSQHARPADPIEGGTGQGAPSAFIEFTPALFLHPDLPEDAAPVGVHPFRTDAVLLHEIVHAVEAMWGTIRLERRIILAHDWSRTCEQRALRVTNMYRSEHHRPLRGPYSHGAFLDSSGEDFSHGGLRAIQGQDRMIGFRGVRRVARSVSNAQHGRLAAFESELIGEFMLDLPSLTWRLEQIPRTRCEYNPFKDFLVGTYDFLLLPGYWLPEQIAIDDLSNVG